MSYRDLCWSDAAIWAAVPIPLLALTPEARDLMKNKKNLISIVNVLPRHP